MAPDIWSITAFTIGVATLATALVSAPAILLAWVLARRAFFGKAVVETIASLPLVMPPVATGVLLLWTLGRRSTLGRLLDRAGLEVIFTWKAVVLAMAVMGFPLLVRTARAGFEQVNRRYEDMAATLGARPSRIFLTISLPLASRSLVAGALLAFSRALGEFGATVMVAGSIPGKTLTLPVAIYTLTETGRDGDAATLMLVAFAIAFVAVAASNALQSARPRA
jgi:molybdate transport system permease protein